MGERYEQSLVATIVEKAGYQTYLPQRDGLILGNQRQIYLNQGYTQAEATQLASEDIFNFDVYQIFKCDGLVSNAIGVAPDSG